LFHKAAAKSVKIESLLEANNFLVYGDPVRLRQTVLNLISNAIKFTSENGEIEISLQKVGSVLELKVRDNGIGIDKKFLPHVFEKFRQADSTTTRTYGGLGLGLTLVKQLIELHGGTVSAQSDGEGQGAVFTVNLPILSKQ
jgi:signal transduction histidine kinase